MQALDWGRGLGERGAERGGGGGGGGGGRGWEGGRGSVGQVPVRPPALGGVMENLGTSTTRKEDWRRTEASLVQIGSDTGVVLSYEPPPSMPTLMDLKMQLQQAKMEDIEGKLNMLHSEKSSTRALEEKVRRLEQENQELKKKRSGRWRIDDERLMAKIQAKVAAVQSQRDAAIATANASSDQVRLLRNKNAELQYEVDRLTHAISRMKSTKAQHDQPDRLDILLQENQKLREEQQRMSEHMGSLINAIHSSTKHR